MFQFTEKEIAHIRAKSQKEPQTIDELKKKTQMIYEDEIRVPKEGIANWTMYYFCSDCSVPLHFDRTKEFHHECPVCGRVYDGEPYNSSWWGHINLQNTDIMYQMALIYLATEDMSYARKVIDILLEYSKYYADYKVHGDIPYNGPGKSGAQTLDEAVFIRNHALSYDLLEGCMTLEEKEGIRDRLLIPGAEFLLEHRHKQIHNHEVITSSAIGIVGILFDRKEFIQFGLCDDYGLIYQLEHGMLEDYMWFEGTFGYHYYALESFIAFEKFAIHTKYSNMQHSNYKNMFELILDYIMPDDSFPLLNDTYPGHRGLSERYLYEFAYKHIPSEKMLQIMNLIYKNQKRDNMYAFFYGADSIPKADFTPSEYHSEKGMGNTILRGNDGQYLLFKHGNYGGEHDHYDRLAISYLAHEERITPDLGTTGYGATLHYDYYKNTGTHNTVTINEKNQPPACGNITRYEKKDGVTYVEAKVDWSRLYEMPDSFTIVQWDEKSYQNVKMTRKLAWTGEYLVELFLVEGVDHLSIDWAMHFCGTRVTKEREEIGVKEFTKKKPLKYLSEVTSLKMEGALKSTYQIGSAKVDLHSYISGGEIFFGRGPDNPSTHKMSYEIERIRGDRAVFLHVLESYREESVIDHVQFSCKAEKAEVKITGKNGLKKICFMID